MKEVVILCRHGNTFEKGERIFLVGSKQDLPLTPEGRAQALRVARALHSEGVVLARISAAPLSRTRVFAEIIRDIVSPQLAISLDERLSELDYGAWGGLSDEEIQYRYGLEALQSWRDRGVRPSGVDFSPSIEAVNQQAQQFLVDHHGLGGVSLAVTSNGRLREWGPLLRDSVQASQPSYAVKTGHMSLLCKEGDRWRIAAWNVEPEALPQLW